MFDPYHKWLAIPRKDQPPNHYRLLALDLFEDDADVIDAAANRQMAYVQQRSTGEHAALSQKLLNELSAARLCLLDRKKKAAYDAALRAKAVKPPEEAATPQSSALQSSALKSSASQESAFAFLQADEPAAEAGADFTLSGSKRTPVARRRVRKPNPLPIILAAVAAGLIAVIAVAVFLSQDNSQKLASNLDSAEKNAADHSAKPSAPRVKPLKSEETAAKPAHDMDRMPLPHEPSPLRDPSPLAPNSSPPDSNSSEPKDVADETIHKPAAATASDMLPGPILLMTFEPASLRYEDDALTEVVDQSGHGLKGHNHGATVVAGKAGKALHFSDGAYMTIPGKFPAGDHERSIAFWIRSAQENAPSGHAIVYGNPLPHEGDELFCVQIFRGNWYFNTHGPMRPLDTRVTVDAEWHHHCLVYDGTKFIYWIDGVAVVSTFMRCNTSPGPMCLGTFFDGKTPFSGDIDELVVYDRPLAADEIQRFYHRGKEGLPLSGK